MKIVSKVIMRFRKARIIGRLRDKGGPRLTKIGTKYGGWNIPASAIRPGMTAVCVGAGEDISFDLELNKRGLKVFTLDPTPRARKHVKQLLAEAEQGGRISINNSPTEHYQLSGFDRSRFTFVEAGVWNEDKIEKFFAPKDPRHVSHSIVNLQ